MKITVCGSQANAKKIYEIITELEKAGHSVFSHELMKRAAEGDAEISERIKKEHYKLKIENDTFKWYYNAIKNSDIVLVCNFEKNNIPGYIGGSVLMELAHAHVLDKPIYFLFPIPESTFKDELIALQPKIINGNLNKL